MPSTSYAIALGSNRCHGRHGRPLQVVRAGVKALADAGLVVRRTSPVLTTPAIGPGGRCYANAAIMIESPLEPPALLALLKHIEQHFGRRRGRRWGARVLDLDILLWSGGRWPRRGNVLGHAALVIPHIGLSTRDFVLKPLVAIAPDWRDPRTGRTMRQLLRRLQAS